LVEHGPFYPRTREKEERLSASRLSYKTKIRKRKGEREKKKPLNGTAHRASKPRSCEKRGWREKRKKRRKEKKKRTPKSILS